MMNNSSFHDDAWKAAEKSLSGTELHSGGAKKSAESCKTCYATISLILSMKTAFIMHILPQLAEEVLCTSQDTLRLLRIWLGRAQRGGDSICRCLGRVSSREYHPPSQPTFCQLIRINRSERTFQNGVIHHFHHMI